MIAILQTIDLQKVVQEELTALTDHNLQDLSVRLSEIRTTVVAEQLKRLKAKS